MLKNAHSEVLRSINTPWSYLVQGRQWLLYVCVSHSGNNALPSRTGGSHYCVRPDRLQEGARSLSAWGSLLSKWDHAVPIKTVAFSSQKCCRLQEDLVPSPGCDAEIPYTSLLQSATQEAERSCLCIQAFLPQGAHCPSTIYPHSHSVRYIILIVCDWSKVTLQASWLCED